MATSNESHWWTSFLQWFVSIENNLTASSMIYTFWKHKKFKCLLYQYLAKQKHNLKYVKVQPLEVVQKQPGQSHKQFEKSRKTSELDWIKKLQTA